MGKYIRLEGEKTIMFEVHHQPLQKTSFLLLMLLLSVEGFAIRMNEGDLVCFSSTSLTSLTMSPTIGEFSAPTIVYANVYFPLNATINNSNSSAYLINATVQISGRVILKWENRTQAFSIHSDPNNYSTIDEAHCFKTKMNFTAFRLTWQIKLNWIYPQGCVDVINTNTKVYDSAGASGSGSKSVLFIFENDAIINSASVNESRVNPSDNISFTGTVYMEGTSSPPCSRNSAIEFDGVDDYVEVAEDTSLRPSTIAVEVWIQTVQTSLGRIVMKPNSSSYQSWSLLINLDAGKVQFRTDTPSTVYATSTTNINDGFWHHIVGTDDGSNLKIYVDGVLEETTPVSSGLEYSEEAPLIIGAGSVEPIQCFDGIIDELRIYNRTLLADEVSEHHQGIYKNETGLVLYMDFDGDCEDKSSQGNHGTSYGAAWTTGAYVNVDVKVKLNGVLKQAVSIVNATDGSFTIPNVQVESKPGEYAYTIYVITPYGKTIQNLTLNIVVEREPWYRPLARWLIVLSSNLSSAGQGVLTNPVTWVAFPVVILIATLFCLGIIKVEIEKPAQEAERLQDLADSLLQPLIDEDKQFDILQQFLHELFDENPPNETQKFLRNHLQAIIDRLIKSQKNTSQ